MKLNLLQTSQKKTGKDFSLFGDPPKNSFQERSGCLAVSGNIEKRDDTETLFFLQLIGKTLANSAVG